MPVFVSCNSSKNEDNMMNSDFFKECFADDSKPLCDCLTREYDLNELINFFNCCSMNENIVFNTTSQFLSFSDVNKCYPIEAVRTNGYSVYKVSQGGYFYVFWVESLAAVHQSNSEPYVYFSAYLASDISADRFDSLTIGTSTAEDVKKIDPSFELSFLSSSGIFSYSYINDETILQIEYAYQENIDGYDDLIVKDIAIVARASAPTKYSALLSSDLP